MIKSKTQLQADIEANATFNRAQKDILENVVDSYQNVFPQVTTEQRNGLTATAGLTVFNTETARHEYWNGAQWLPVGNSISTCQMQKVVVTAEQLRNLHSVPVTLLPTPGPGYIAAPVAGFIRLTYVSEAYNFEPDTVTVIFNGNKEVYNMRMHTLPSDMLNESVNCVFGFEGGSDGPVDPMEENDSVVLFSFSEATQGNGILTLWILYSIIPY